MSTPQMSSYRNMAHLQKHFDRLMVASKAVLEIYTDKSLARSAKSVEGFASEIHGRYERLKTCITNIEKMEENP